MHPQGDHIFFDSLLGRRLPPHFSRNGKGEEKNETLGSARADFRLALDPAGGAWPNTRPQCRRFLDLYAIGSTHARTALRGGTNPLLCHQIRQEISFGSGMSIPSRLQKHSGNPFGGGAGPLPALSPVRRRIMYTLPSNPKDFKFCVSAAQKSAPASIDPRRSAKPP